MTDIELARDRPATSVELRRLSADRILNALRDQNAMTASRLMEATGMSRTAIHRVCADLAELGLIIESGDDDSASVDPPPTIALRGRPPHQYRFAAEAGAIVSLDFGVNTVRALIADLRGTTRARTIVQVGDALDLERPGFLDDLVDETLRAAGMSSNIVGVAVVGVPMALSSNVAIAYPDREHVIEISERWGKANGWPVLIENDANLAALGERRIGAAQSIDDVIVLLAGERLGAGIISSGALLRGAHASAGELRFLSMLSDSEPEHVGAATHTRMLAERALQNGSATQGLREAVHRDSGPVQARSVFLAAEAGDSSAADIVHTVSERLAQVVGILATVLDPSVVVISGGIAEAGDLLARTVQDLLPAEIIDNPPQVVASTLGSEAVLGRGRQPRAGLPRGASSRRPGRRRIVAEPAAASVRIAAIDLGSGSVASHPMALSLDANCGCDVAPAGDGVRQPRGSPCRPTIELGGQPHVQRRGRSPEPASVDELQDLVASGSLECARSARGTRSPISPIPLGR